MPTPMHVFAKIASQYGVDPQNDDAVDEFFVRKAAMLSKKDQANMLSELLQDVPSPAVSNEVTRLLYLETLLAKRNGKLMSLRQGILAGICSAAGLFCGVILIGWPENTRVNTALATLAPLLVLLVDVIVSRITKRLSETATEETLANLLHARLIADASKPSVQQKEETVSHPSSK